MGLQKRLNKRLIKMAIGSKYVYEIEAEEKVKSGYYEEDNEQPKNNLKSFLQDGINEMKKEMKKEIKKGL